MALFKNLRELLGFGLNGKSYSLCMVVSEQEGAEIWLQGQRTNFVTPKMVAMPKNRDVRLEVRQLGYEPHAAWVRTDHDLSFHYCDLKRIPLKLVYDEENSPAHAAAFGS